ncbi:MAG: ammonia channel protein, partial [Deltaproteobacteria bacterium]|nr:ammonia channel protein [Deltaproteobacteria bacterium]
MHRPWAPHPLRRQPPVNPINSGDTAFVLLCAGLVMFMTPGLAFFYGGLVRAKNVVHTMILSIVCMAVVGVLWALVGYSLSFSSGTFD